MIIKLYHGVSREYRSHIYEHRLVPSNYDSNAVYFASKPGKPSEYIDTWEVDTNGLYMEDDRTTSLHKSEEDELGWPWFVVYETVSPDRLKLMGANANE